MKEQSNAARTFAFTFDSAEAIHEVIRAFNDGECPQCYVLDAVSIPDRRNDERKMTCPHCGFSISNADVREGMELYASIMSAKREVFEQWRMDRARAAFTGSKVRLLRADQADVHGNVWNAALLQRMAEEDPSLIFDSASGWLSRIIPEPELTKAMDSAGCSVSQTAAAPQDDIDIEVMEDAGGLVHLAVRNHEGAHQLIAHARAQNGRIEMIIPIPRAAFNSFTFNTKEFVIAKARETLRALHKLNVSIPAF